MNRLIDCLMPRPVLPAATASPRGARSSRWVPSRLALTAMRERLAAEWPDRMAAAPGAVCADRADAGLTSGATAAASASHLTSLAGAPDAIAATAAPGDLCTAGRPAAAAGREPEAAGDCGWYESSHSLREGLAVTEWPEEDWATAVLYFVPDALRPAWALQ